MPCCASLPQAPHASVSTETDEKGWDWTTAYDEDKYAACLVEKKCSAKAPSGLYFAATCCYSLSLFVCVL